MSQHLSPMQQLGIYEQETKARTTMNTACESRPTVIRSGRESSFSPSGSITLEFDWDDAERARHVLRNMVADIEGRLEEIIAKVGVR